MKKCLYFFHLLENKTSGYGIMKILHSQVMISARKVIISLRHSILPHLFFAKKVFHYTTKGRNHYNNQLTHRENAKNKHKGLLFIFGH